MKKNRIIFQPIFDAHGGLSKIGYLKDFDDKPLVKNFQEPCITWIGRLYRRLTMCREVLFRKKVSVIFLDKKRMLHIKSINYNCTQYQEMFQLLQSANEGTMRYKKLITLDPVTLNGGMLEKIVEN